MMFGSQWSEKADTRVWRAFGKVNLRLVELVGVGSETSYYWFNWSSAKRLDPQRISFLFLFLDTLQLQFSLLIQWFMICFHYRNNAIIFFIESNLFKNFSYYNITSFNSHAHIHYFLLTYIVLFIYRCQVQKVILSSIYYILDLPVSTHFNGDIILYDVMVVMKLWSFSFKQVILILVT